MGKGMNCLFCSDVSCGSSEDQLGTCGNATMCYKTTTMLPDGTRRYYRGCIKSQMGELFLCKNKSNLRLRSSIEKGLGGLYHTDCCEGNLCNSGTFPYLPEPEDAAKVSTLAIVIGLSFISLFVALAIIYGLFSCFCKKRQNERIKNKKWYFNTLPSIPPLVTSKEFAPDLRYTTPGESTMQELYQSIGSMTSGSGAGMPILTQQTLGQQITLVDCMSTITKPGSGTFGREIWRGVRLGENVAVKIYSSRDEPTWDHEINIYSKIMNTRHENILGIIGCDVVSRFNCTQMWIVTDYCLYGSLYQYLVKQPKLDYNQMFNLCLSLVSGLLYLHQEILGSVLADVKPSVAHRNLNPKSIFVRADGTCVIGDLSYAITQDKLSVEKSKRFREVSRLYMAPELLKETFDSKSLDDFCRADIYSLGIILWDICSKSTRKNIALEYALPYSHIFGKNPNPTFDQMRKLVINYERRPKVPDHWNSEATMLEMEFIMQECWFEKVSSRLPILRIKKSLVNLALRNPSVHLLVNTDAD